MRELKKEFQKWGGEVTFRQVLKTNKVVVYQCNGRWYELFKYKVCKPNKFIDEEYEKYPSDESFGRWAWHCHDLSSVERVLNERKKYFDISDDDITSIIAQISDF